MVIPLSARWRQLLFANWPADADWIEPRIPAGLAVDTFDDTAWVSIVVLRNEAVRPQGVPRWLGLDTPSINVRTYVTGPAGQGVYFFSLDVFRWPAVIGARLTHHLPFYHARGRHDATDGQVRVACQRDHPGAEPAHLLASYRPAGQPFVTQPGTLAEFITDRDRLYIQAPDGGLETAVVTHDRWTLYPAEASIHANSLVDTTSFPQATAGSTYYYSPGLPVTISRRRQLRVP